MPHSETVITNQTLNWLNSFVIKLNLCPFAKGPVNKGSLRVQVSTTKKTNQALEDLITEVLLLDATPAIETTLLVYPNAFKDFLTYLDLLALAEEILIKQGYEGVYQIASFHPDYYFEGTDFNDVSNFTNRSPYPMLHLLREETLDKAIAAYGDTSKIPERNQATLRQLGIEGMTEILGKIK